MYSTFHLNILDIITLSCCHMKKRHYPNFTQVKEKGVRKLRKKLKVMEELNLHHMISCF